MNYLLKKSESNLERKTEILFNFSFFDMFKNFNKESLLEENIKAYNGKITYAGFERIKFHNKYGLALIVNYNKIKASQYRGGIVVLNDMQDITNLMLKSHAETIENLVNEKVKVYLKDSHIFGIEPYVYKGPKFITLFPSRLE